MAGLYAAGPGPEPLVLISERPLMDHEGAAFLWLKTFIRGEFAKGLVVEAPEAPCALLGEEGAEVDAVICDARDRCSTRSVLPTRAPMPSTSAAPARAPATRPTQSCRPADMTTRTSVTP